MRVAWARRLAWRAARPLGAPSRRRCARSGSPRLKRGGTAGTPRMRRTAPQTSNRTQDWFRGETKPATPPARASATSGDRVAGLLACGHATVIWAVAPTGRAFSVGSIRPMARCGVRSHLQRRGRSGFSPDSLFWPASAGHPRSQPHTIGPAPADSSEKCAGFWLDIKGGLLTCWAVVLY